MARMYPSLCLTTTPFATLSLGTWLASAVRAEQPVRLCSSTSYGTLCASRNCCSVIGDTHGFLLSVADATTGREKPPRRVWGRDQRQPVATGSGPLRPAKAMPSPPGRAFRLHQIYDQQRAPAMLRREARSSDWLHRTKMEALEQGISLVTKQCRQVPRCVGAPPGKGLDAARLAATPPMPSSLQQIIRVRSVP